MRVLMAGWKTEPSGISRVPPLLGERSDFHRRFSSSSFLKGSHSYAGNAMVSLFLGKKNKKTRRCALSESIQ